MIQIDRHKVDELMFAAKVNELGKMESFRSPEGKAYAICLKDAFDLISSVIYLREHGATVLLFHADTPFETAKKMSIEAGCTFLQYGDWNDVCELGGVVSFVEPGLLQFSSGTTGQPKLIFRSWNEVDQEVQAYNSSQQLKSEEPSLILVPVSHSFGLIAGVFTAMARGAEVVVVQNKNPKFQLHMINSVEQSFLYAVPFLYHLLINLGKEKVRFHKLVSSGAPLSDALLGQLQSRSYQVWQQYGCTEAGCISLGADPASRSDMGYVLPHLKVNIQSADLPDHGEIVVETLASSRIQTRDVGYITAEGRLQVHGRLDDLINISGLKVIPMEVEGIIERMPGVKEAVVFRTKHPVWGEAAKALIVADKQVAASDVKNWCLDHLPPYKIPGFIEKVPELPRLPSGKISRKLLEEQERIKYE